MSKFFVENMAMLRTEMTSADYPQLPYITISVRNTSSPNTSTQLNAAKFRSCSPLPLSFGFQGFTWLNTVNSRYRADREVEKLVFSLVQPLFYLIQKSSLIINNNLKIFLTIIQEISCSVF